VCKDALTLKAVAGAEIWITTKKIKRTTGAKGISYVQHLPGGVHSVQVKHNQYATQTVSCACIDNTNVKLEVLLHLE
jgi:hypothetical protein